MGGGCVNVILVSWRYGSRMSDSLDRLYEAVIAARNADPVVSRTARLLQAGPTKVAKKLGEEAIEVVIDAIDGNKDNVVRESADLLYHLVVLWVELGINPKHVWAEMDRREQLFGIAEKRLKELDPKARRKVASLAAHRLQKRR
jgi:phosphoribosyl-ATP pyrophosphohydrolase